MSRNDPRDDGKAGAEAAERAARGNGDPCARASSGARDDRASRDDPRCHEEFVRRIRGDDCGDVALLGVVHDHPSSAHRVRELVRSTGPDVLALELAPLAVPAYARLASADSAPAARGGEMRAAIEASPARRTVGIDGPSLSSLRTALATANRRDASVRTVLRFTSRFSRVGARCLASRVRTALGTALGTAGGGHLVVPGGETEHEVDADDDPATQAAHERSQVQRASAIGSALQPPPAAAYRDATREAHMARRLRALRADGDDVAAVVGAAHLDGIEERLRDR